MSNAVKFTPPRGSITLEVQLLNEMVPPQVNVIKDETLTLICRSNSNEGSSPHKSNISYDRSSTTGL